LLRLGRGRRPLDLARSPELAQWARGPGPLWLYGPTGQLYWPLGPAGRVDLETVAGIALAGPGCGAKYSASPLSQIRVPYVVIY